MTKNQSFESLYLPISDTAANSHSSIQPLSSSEFNSTQNYDSLVNGLNASTKSGLFDLILNNYLVESRDKKFGLMMSPLINIGGGIEKTDSSTNNLSEVAFGLNTKLYFGEKWTADFSFLADNSQYPEHIDELLTTKNGGQGYGYTNNGNSMYYQGYVNFQASKIFNFQAGMGKHFIGDGYRSLFLSDYTTSYPYFKATATFWKIKYMALYANLYETPIEGGGYNDYKHKFTAIHYLSYNATKWLNIGFFESIIWQAQEGKFYRGLDINYLNPIILLRPVEYYQGSADNALLGGSLKLRIKKKFIFYSQIILDEFLLSELRANRGWWGNKYGVQTGFKTHYLFGINNLSFQFELNNVRPFTYSYFELPTDLNTIQNYGHASQPLAHPLGANFKETFVRVGLTKKRWIIEAQSTLAKIGFDTNGTTSIGQDIYKPYNLREEEYGYNTGGGINTTILNNSLKVSFVLNPKMQTIIQLGVNNRQFKNSSISENANWISFGIKTALINQYFDR